MIISGPVIAAGTDPTAISTTIDVDCCIAGASSRVARTIIAGTGSSYVGIGVGADSDG